MWLRTLGWVVTMMVAARVHAQPTLPFKSRELQEGKNSLGKLTAQLAVGEASGEISYRYAIELPAGRGVTPDVALEYSSHAGQSEYGWGWTLTIPTIERSDERGVGASPPLAFPVPAFRFRNGAQSIELVREGALPNGWELWRERRETTFTRYLRNQGFNTWRMLRPDGVRLDLGTTSGSRRGVSPAQEPTTSMWQVVAISDTRGNYAQYNYGDDGLITSIRYNGNNVLAYYPTMMVQFEWSTIAPVEQRVSYRSGFARFAGHRSLRTIQVSAPTHTVGSSPARVPANSPTARSYSFTYSDRSDVNNMYYLRSAQLDTFPPVTFEYSEPGPRAGVLDTRRVFGANHPSFPRDLGFSQVHPTSNAPEWTRTRRVLIDVTRDGRADILEADDDGAFILWRNVGTSTLVREPWPAPQLAPAVPSPEAGTLRAVQHINGVENTTVQDFVDLSGDGFPDLVYVESGAVFMCPGTGYGFGTCTMFHNGSPAIPYLRRESTLLQSTSVSDVDLTDFNADGRIDYLVTQGTVGVVYLNNGHGFDTSPLTFAMPSCAPYSLTCIRLTQMGPGNGPNRLMFVETRDVNGDGLPDHLVGSGNGQMEIYFGNGRGFESQPAVVAIPNAIGYGNQASDGTYVAIGDMVDVNGDGLVDIVTADCTSSSPLSVRVRYNNGGTWDAQSVHYSWTPDPLGRLYEQPCLSRVSPMGTFDKSFITATLADMNGDGIPDLVTADVDPGAPGGFGFQFVVRQLPYVPPRKLLRAMSLNKTHVMDVVYAPVVGELPYPIHAPARVTKSRAALYAFESPVNLSRTTTYEYSPPVFDAFTRGFGGFEQVVATGDSHTTTVRTSYHTGHQRAGAVDSRYVLSISGNETSDYTRYEYALDLGPAVGRSLFRLTAVHKFAGLQRHTSTRYFGQDDYGNITSWVEEGDASNTSDNVLHEVSYAVRDDTFSTQQFINAVPYEESGNSPDNGARSKTRYYYDNSLALGAVPTYGNVTRVEREKTAGVFVASRSSYDTAGNLVSFTDEMNATTTYTYDGTHRLYRVSATDQLGTVHSSYHSLLAAEADTCGPQYSVSGGVTTYNCRRTEVDGLGRVTATYVPTLTAGAYGMALLSTITYDESVYPFVTVKTTRGNSRVIQYSDGFGNPVQQRIEIASTNGTSQFRVFESSFDAYGAPRRVELPRVETGTAFTHAPISTEAWTYEHDYVHDSIARITQPRDPGDLSSPPTASRVVNPDHVVLVDEDGNRTEYYIDGHNRISHVDRIDRLNGTRSKTHFTYNDRGDVTSIIDPVGLTTRYARNLLGWPVTVTTPDARVWSYSYNDRGHVTEMTQPNGAIVAYGYDSIGRPTSIATTTVPTGIRAIKDNLVWCTDSTQLGHLCKESSPLVPGIRTYEYTAEGALHAHTLKIPTVLTARVELDYDLGARLRSVRYPDTTVVTYEYNLDDSVASVRGSSKEFARVLYEDSGLPSVITNDYGLDESFVYEARGRLRALRSTNVLAGLNGDLIDDSFEWSPAGELKRLSRFGVTTTQVPRPTPEIWDITHDGFGRVESVSANSNLLGRYRYDLSGKLTEFSERNQPIRTSIYSLDQLQSRTMGTREKKWTYDANGQVVLDELFDGGALRRTRRYEWDGLGRIASVYAGSPFTQYVYTPRGALHAVRKPTEFDGDDVFYIGDYHYRTLAGVANNRVIVDGRVIGELSAGGAFEMAHRGYDGSVLAVSKWTSGNSASIVRQEEFTPYGAHLAGAQTPASASFVEYFHGLRKDELTVAGGRPYDDEDGLWLTRDVLPRSNPSRVASEPRLAQMYSFNFGDPLRWRDRDGQNPAVIGGIGAGLELGRQLLFEDEVDWGRVATVGVASAGGAWIFGKVASLGGAVNAAAGAMLSSVSYEAITRTYDKKYMSVGDVANSISGALATELLLIKGVQALGLLPSATSQRSGGATFRDAATGAGTTVGFLPRGGTYVLRDPLTQQVMRTGRSGNLAERARQHGRDPALRDLTFEVVHRTDIYAQQRGLEQLLHDKYQPPLNKIRPISPTNPRRQHYLDAAKQFLEDQ